MLSFDCGGCGKHFTVRDEFAGRQTRCKQCGAVNRIPEAAAPAPEVQEWEAVSLPVQQPSVAFDPLLYGSVPLPGPMSAGLGSAGPAPIGRSIRKANKVPRDNNAAFWCILSVGGFVGAALLIVVVFGIAMAARGLGGRTNDSVARSDAAPKPGFWARHFGGANKNAVAYLPANYKLVVRMRVLDLIDHVQSVPSAKAYLNREISEPARPGQRIEQPDDLYLLTDGATTYLVATTRGAVNAKLSLPQGRPSGSHLGTTIYQDEKYDPRASKPFAPLRFFGFPHDRLMVAASDRPALIRMLDQAAANVRPAIDLPQGDVVFHVKDVGLLDLPRGGPIHPGDVVAVTASATFGSMTSFSVSLKTRDAGVAEALRTKASGALEEAKTSWKDSPGSAQAALLQTVQVSSVSDQLTLSGVVPLAQLVDLGILGGPAAPQPGVAAARRSPFMPPINFQFGQPLNRALSPGADRFSQIPGMMQPPTPNLTPPTFSPGLGNHPPFGAPGQGAQPPMMPQRPPMMQRPPRMTPHGPRHHMGRR